MHCRCMNVACVRTLLCAQVLPCSTDFPWGRLPSSQGLEGRTLADILSNTSGSSSSGSSSSRTSSRPGSPHQVPPAAAFAEPAAAAVSSQSPLQLLVAVTGSTQGGSLEQVLARSPGGKMEEREAALRVLRPLLVGSQGGDDVGSPKASPRCPCVAAWGKRHMLCELCDCVLQVGLERGTIQTHEGSLLA